MLEYAAVTRGPSTLTHFGLASPRSFIAEKSQVLFYLVFCIYLEAGIGFHLRRSLGKKDHYTCTAPEHARATRAPSHPNCRVPRSVGFRPQTPFQSTQTQPACRRARFPNSARRRAYGAQSAPSSRTLVCACVRAAQYGRTGRWGCGWGSSPDAAAPIRTRPFGETRGARTAL